MGRPKGNDKGGKIVTGGENGRGIGLVEGEILIGKNERKTNCPPHGVLEKIGGTLKHNKREGEKDQRTRGKKKHGREWKKKKKANTVPPPPHRRQSARPTSLCAPKLEFDKDCREGKENPEQKNVQGVGERAERIFQSRIWKCEQNTRN